MALTSNDTKANFILNKLTQEQYDQLKSEGRINENEWYFILDKPNPTEELRQTVIQHENKIQNIESMIGDLEDAIRSI